MRHSQYFTFQFQAPIILFHQQSLCQLLCGYADVHLVTKKNQLIQMRSVIVSQQKKGKLKKGNKYETGGTNYLHTAIIMFGKKYQY